MNIPNKLTILRLLLLFLIVPLLYIENTMARVIATIAFIVALWTDWYDGRLARRKNLKTIFGTFLDPVVDKVLIIVILIALADLDIIPSWIVMVLVAREFIVTGIRQTGTLQGIEIGANKMGKTKIFAQMIAILTAFVFLILTTLPGWNKALNTTMLNMILLLMVLTVILAVVFGIIFVYKNQKVILKEI